MLKLKTEKTASALDFVKEARYAKPADPGLGERLVEGARKLVGKGKPDSAGRTAVDKLGRSGRAAIDSTKKEIAKNYSSSDYIRDRQDTHIRGLHVGSQAPVHKGFAGSQSLSDRALFRRYGGKAEIAGPKGKLPG